MPPVVYTDRDRSLERALIANFLVHGLALASMALVLMPMLPGGSAASDLTRVAEIAAHPWRFRLGWLPWQASAVIDLWLALAMVRTRWLSRSGAIAVLFFTIVAVIPDQGSQAVWITRGVKLATQSPETYLALERQLFPWMAGWGALFYTVAALGWTFCFARAGTWSRALTIVSVFAWSLLAVASIAPLLPVAHRPSPAAIAGANALGFLALQLWLGLVCEAVLLRARPSERFGRLAPWRHPGRGPLARLAELLANSRLAGALLEPLPETTMRSDIAHVVYVNYLVPADVAAEIVPPGLELERLGPDGRWALLSFLTYQHGHFGFAFLGPLRKLMPSPVQTNWRVHVVDPHTGRAGIYFLTNAITHVVPALAARLTTEGMPMHVLRSATVVREASGALRVTLDPGSGSAPDAELHVRPTATPPELEGAWAECFRDYEDFLRYCVPQDRALSSQPLRRRVSRQEIDLGIPIAACVPVEGTVTSRAARDLTGDAVPLCFYVPQVAFVFSKEAHDLRP